MVQRRKPHQIDASGLATGKYVLDVVDGKVVGLVAGGAGGGASALNDLTDVDTATTPPIDQQALVWNETSGQWESGTLGTLLDIRTGTTPVSAGVARTSTSSSTYTAMTWKVNFRGPGDYILNSLTWDARNADTYTLSIDGVDVATAVAGASPTTGLVFTPAAPIILASDIEHIFKIRGTAARTQYFSSNNTLIGSASYITAWSFGVEFVNNYVAATLNFTPPKIVPARLPMVLLENGASSPPAGTPAGTIGFRKAAAGSVNSGKAIGWWDGTQWQPLA